MKFSQYLSLIADTDGFIPTPHFRYVLQKNERPTAREEAIVAKIREAANPRENLSGRYPWGEEEQKVLQQLWIHPTSHEADWRKIPEKDFEQLYSVHHTEYGELPAPKALDDPGPVKMDIRAKIREALGQDIEPEKPHCTCDAHGYVADGLCIKCHKPPANRQLDDTDTFEGD